MEERQDLSDFVNKINNLFGLQEQGRELVTSVAKATGCRYACLLFLDTYGENFNVLACLPKSKINPFHNLMLSRQNPMVRYIRQEKKLLTKDNLATSPKFREGRASKINTGEIELIIPMISRNRLMGILVLGEKHSGEYSNQDYNLLRNLIELVAVGMEKEYLREQLRRQKKELSIINRSRAIMASSLDIQQIFDGFIKELKKIAPIDWATINFIEDGDICLLALFSEIDTAWKVGDRMPLLGTATDWVIEHKITVVEPDISQESRFVTPESNIKPGVRSVAYLPLITEGRAIGSLIVASLQVNAYSQKQIALIEELTSQIIMPIENSQLYAEAEAKARIDGLTGLFNRRSFDEVMASETSRYSRYGGIYSLIIFDLDGGLRTINNTYGHPAGDETLRQTGVVIRKAIRTSDRAFRYGGDEFAIFLPNTSIDAANMVADRVRKQIGSLIVSPGTRVTASLGLASWPANGKVANAVISAADTALYQAKRNGGNRSQRANT